MADQPDPFLRALAVASLRASQPSASLNFEDFDRLPTHAKQAHESFAIDVEEALAEAGVAILLPDGQPGRWRPMASAPRDGRAILACGIHDGTAPDAGRGVKAGDFWWAILIFDIWREPHRWVFSKDGAPAWSEPLAFQLLDPVPALPVQRLDGDVARSDRG